jgi:hypothetical protein
MNKKTQKWESRISTIVDVFKRLDAEAEKWTEIGALEIDCELHQAIFCGFEELLSLLDESGWIHWYIFDNECGDHRLSARPNAESDMREIITPRDLAELIVASKS